MREWFARTAVRGIALVVVTSCSSNEPTAPATLLASAAAGDGQTALVGFPTNIRPAVRVTDLNHNPTPNVSVTFAVTGGGGSVTGSAAVSTNANGVAQVGGWVVGASPGTNTLSATVPGTGGPITFTAAGVSPSFHVVIQNVGPALSPAVQSAFDSAVAMWQRVIYVGLPPIQNFSDTANACGRGFPAVGPTTINDVMIQIRFDSIDGPGQILGRSGPCFVRAPPDNRTVLGTMIFDTADVAALVSQGHINEVILHEMAHVFGFGTLWGTTFFNCLQLPASAGTFPDTYYSCPKARAEFDSIGGTGYTGGTKVPLENCQGISGCGAGTFNSHWRESVFFNELLTGYLNSGVANPLSALTIAAIEDLGYTVNDGAAAPYARTFTSPPAGLAASSAASTRIGLGDDIVRGPIHVVDRSGRVVRVIRP